MAYINNYSLDPSYYNIINNSQEVDNKEDFKSIMFYGKKKTIYKNTKKYLFCNKPNLYYFFKILTQKIYIKNLFKKKNYKLSFKKDLKKVKKERKFLNVFEKNNVVKIDMISGEILNNINVNNTLLEYKSRFKCFKKKNILFLLFAKFLIFNIKKKKKIKTLGFWSKTKLVSLRNNIYILNNIGKFLILKTTKRYINDLITLKFKNSYNINLRKTIGDKCVILTVNSSNCQTFMFFLKKWKNFLFFRNPIFLKFGPLINNIKFISMKKCLFFVLYSGSIILPIQINLKSAGLLKKKKPPIFFYGNENAPNFNFCISNKNVEHGKKLNLIKICRLPKFKKKILILTFKKYRKKSNIPKEIIGNLLIKIDKFLKYKHYKINDSGFMILILIKKFLNKIEPGIANPLINFVIRTLFISDKNFLRNILIIGEALRYHFLSLKNNEFFFGFISQHFKYPLLLKHDILFKSIDDYILKGQYK